MWLNFLSLGVKTAAHLYKNKQETKCLCLMQRNLMLKKWQEVKLNMRHLLNQISKALSKMNLYSFLYLCLFFYWLGLSFLTIQRFMLKLTLFFEYFNQLPYWYQAIFIGVVSAIYGLKATDIMKKK